MSKSRILVLVISLATSGCMKKLMGGGGGGGGGGGANMQRRQQRPGQMQQRRGQGMRRQGVRGQGMRGSQQGMAETADEKQPSEAPPPAESGSQQAQAPATTEVSE